MATNIVQIEKWAGRNKNHKNHRGASELLKRGHFLNRGILRGYIIFPKRHFTESLFCRNVILPNHCLAEKKSPVVI